MCMNSKERQDVSENLKSMISKIQEMQEGIKGLIKKSYFAGDYGEGLVEINKNLDKTKDMIWLYVGVMTTIEI